MAGTSSHSYKTYKRNQRKLVNEGMFTGGMQYSDNPLPEGVSKLLVNMIQKDMGQRVRPRGGWRILAEPVELGTDLGELYTHHSGTILVKDVTANNTVLRRYSLILSKLVNGKYGSTVNSRVLIEEPLDPLNPIPNQLSISTPVAGATHYNVKHNANESLYKIHGMLVTNPSPDGIFASIDGNTYVLTDQGLGRLDISKTAGVYTHKVVLVVPLQVTPMQAVNYGYNMLLAAPFAFANKSGPTFSPQGILPYDITTNAIKMQAKVGEPVRFKLIYEYEAGVSYKVQWEVQDIYKRDGINVIRKKEDSPEYVDGVDIYLDYTSPLKQFSVVATVYKTSDLTNPIRTVLLASYNLSDDTQMAKSEQTVYDLKTASGLAVWKNQMVYYGVQGAEMAIFISDINDPTYVPFPNSSVIFNEKVLKAFPYMNSLMVVTERTKFQVDFDADLGFTYKPVQANMQLREDDTIAMYGVRNMVCFKSNNYYYMVVPNIKNDKGELQVAPISNNITQLLDHFAESIRAILSEVYTLRNLFSAPDTDITIGLYDYKSYPDGNRLRHVYKLKLSIFDIVRYIDLHLIYDTVFRTWTMEIMESTRRPIHVFQAISTGYAQFLNLYTVGTKTFVQWLGVDENNPMDDFHLEEDVERSVQNFQMIDTGKRDLDGNRKKRLRHVILEFNNLNKSDVEFNHVVFMDDDQRSELFKYNVVHVTDPGDPNYGQIYVEREYIEPTTFYGTTGLGFWSLGNSQFPEQTVLKVHLDHSGKGYYPRIRIVTRASKLYELNTISWAYRDMSAR